MYSVLGGSILAGPRPSRKLLKEFVGIVDVVFTLQWETEQPEQIESICVELGIEWKWVPIKAVNWNVYKDEELRGRLFEGVQLAKSLLEQGKSVLIHCAAGIHRTGFFVYSLLRFAGFLRDKALDAILTFRPQILNQIGKHRLTVSENFYQVAQNEPVFTPYYETLGLKQSDFATGKKPVLFWVKTFFHENLAKVQFCATASDFSKIIVGGEVFLEVVERFIWSDLRTFKPENILVESIWDCEEVLHGFLHSCHHGNDIYLSGENSFFDLEMIIIYFPRVFQLLKNKNHFIDLSSLNPFKNPSQSQSIYDDIRLSISIKQRIEDSITQEQEKGKKKEKEKESE